MFLFQMALLRAGQEEIDFIVRYTPRNNFISNLAIDQDGNTLVLFNYFEKHGKPLHNILKDKLMSLLDVLDEREKVIVGDYFGLTGTPRTLEDIGGDFSLTKERVRQIKEKALRKLRNDSSILFDYM